MVGMGRRDGMAYEINRLLCLFTHEVANDGWDSLGRWDVSVGTIDEAGV